MNALQAWHGVRRALANEWLLLTLCVVLGAAVRLYQLGSIPPGLNQDEASLAYDSYSLLHYGMERNGHTWPIMLEAYGSSMSGTLAAYLLMPFIAVGGLTAAMARSLNATMGILFIGVAWAIGREGWGKRTGLFAAFFAAINPWNIMMSRWGLDCNLFPPMFALGFLALLAARGSTWGLATAASVFALCLYCYGTALVGIPVFLTLAFMILLVRRELRWKRTLIALACFLALAMPMATYLTVNELELPTMHVGPVTITNLSTSPRYREGSTLFSPHLPTRLGKSFVKFSKMMYRQYDGFIQNGLPKHGIVYGLGMPLALLGFGVTIFLALRKRHIGSLLLLAWVGMGLAVAVSVDPNISRTNIMMPTLILCCAIATASLRPKALTIGIVCIFLLLFARFTNEYFTTFPSQIARTFFYGLAPAAAEASQRTEGTVCIVGNLNVPEMSVLFATKLDPAIFANTVTYQNPTAHYRHAASFGRYIIGLDRCEAAGGGAAYVVLDSEVEPLVQRNFRIVERFGAYAVMLPPSAL